MNDSYSDQLILSTYLLYKPLISLGFEFLALWALFHLQMEGGPIGLDGDTVRDPVDPGYRPERERAPTRRPAMEGQNAQDPLSNIRTAYCKGAAQVSDVLYRLGIFCIGVYRRCLRLLLIWKEKGGTPRLLKRRVSTSPGVNLRDYTRII